MRSVVPLAVLVVVSILSHPAQAVDFKTTTPMSIADIFSQCAMIGKFNVISEPSLRAQRMSLEMKQATPEEIMDHVVKACSLQTRRYTLAGMPILFIIARTTTVLPPSLPVPPAGAAPVRLSIHSATDVPVIANMLGTLGGFDVLVPPEITAQKQTLSLTGVPASTAVQALAASLGCTVDVVKKKSGRPTYVLRVRKATR